MERAGTRRSTGSARPPGPCPMPANGGRKRRAMGRDLLAQGKPGSCVQGSFRVLRGSRRTARRSAVPVWMDGADGPAGRQGGAVHFEAMRALQRPSRSRRRTTGLAAPSWRPTTSSARTRRSATGRATARSSTACSRGPNWSARRAAQRPARAGTRSGRLRVIKTRWCRRCACSQGTARGKMAEPLLRSFRLRPRRRRPVASCR